MSAEQLTPKEQMRNDFRRANTSVFGGVGNPILEEVKDPEHIRQFYANWPIIPFHDGADASLDLFELCQNLSPTNGGIITTIRDFTLGGEFEVVNRKRSGLARHEDDKEVVVSKEDSERFWDFVEEFIPGDQLLEAATEIFDNFKQYGNAFIELSITEVMGKKFIRISNHAAPYCRYLATLPGEQKVVLISPEWSTAYLSKHNPDAVPLYPAFAEVDGSKRTIYHLINKVPTHDWYGLPDWISALYQAYQEIQMGEYGSEEYANRLSAQVIVETQDQAIDVDNEPVEEDGLSFQQGMEYMFTNKHGVRSRFLHRSRDIGVEPMSLWEVSSNRDYEFHKFMSEVTEKQLFKAHSWHPVLSLSTSGKLGGSNEFKQILRVKHQTVIRKYQKKIASVLNMFFRIIAEETNQSPATTDAFSISFRNQFAEMMEEDPTQEIEPEVSSEPVEE